MLRIRAPFAAWRWMQAGVFRGTFPVIPHSAAWGLVLNIAGIETRGDLNQQVTPIRSDAPSLEIAVGLLRTGSRSTLYQQLHSYPVGNSGKEFKERTFGNKYWIAPVRRELLVDTMCVVGARGDSKVLDRIHAGLAGELPEPRYGLPFAGDNQFLFDEITPIEHDVPANWFVKTAGTEPAQKTTRLTTNIDRGDASRTESPLFAPSDWGPVPERAWIRIGPAARSAERPA